MASRMVTTRAVHVVLLLIGLAGLALGVAGLFRDVVAQSLGLMIESAIAIALAAYVLSPN